MSRCTCFLPSVVAVERGGGGSTSFCMQTLRLIFSLPLALLSVAGAAQSYEVGAVHRTRLLVDSRYDAAPDSAALAFIEPYARVVDSIMGPVVGRAAFPMKASRPESPLSNLLADILLEAGADYGERPRLAVYNMGGIRASLPAGDITYGDVLEVAPFDNKICFLTLTGESLMQLFREMAAVGGEGVSRGVELAITPGGRLVSARLDGQEIDPGADYRVATIDYLAEGNDRLEAFKQKKDLNAPRTEGTDARYVIAAYFRKKAARGEAVGAKIEGRIKVEPENSKE